MQQYEADVLFGSFSTKPAEIPVEQPTKFDFVINLKTAAILGLSVPRLCSLGQMG